MPKKNVLLNENVGVTPESTSAAASLAPNSSPVNDPKSKVEALAAIIGDLAKVEVSDLAKLHQQVLAQNSKTLSASIPDGTAESLKKSVEAGTGGSIKNALAGAVKEDVENLFSGEELTEEFKEKTVTLFEAAVNSRVEAEVVRIEEEAAENIDKLLEGLTSEIVNRIDDYMGFVVEEWMKENEIAIQSSLRNDLTEDFIDGLKKLFSEHYIDVPQDKVDVVETLSLKVDSLREDLDTLVSENARLKENEKQRLKEDIIVECSNGLTLSETEKLVELSDGIEFEDVEDFRKKVNILKESAFTKETAKPSKENRRQLTEAIEEDENGPDYVNPQVQRYAEMLNKR